MVFKQEEILLGMKKRGFGVGRWNGFGGKLDGNETIEEGAIRELKQKHGLLPRLAGYPVYPVKVIGRKRAVKKLSAANAGVFLN